MRACLRGFAVATKFWIMFVLNIYRIKMEIKGDATKARFIATAIDHIIAFGMMLVVVRSVPETWPVLRGISVIAGYLGYFFILEGMWGRTLGKYFQGLIVRRLDGSSAGWSAALIRTLLRVVEVNPILFGAIPAGLVLISSKRRQRIGDMLAGTVVVSEKLKWPSDDKPNAN